MQIDITQDIAQVTLELTAGDVDVTLTSPPYVTISATEPYLSLTQQKPYVDLTTYDFSENIHDKDSKSTPVDADEMLLLDSASSYIAKKLTWANLKATLKTYWDTLYAAITHASTHTDGTDDIQNATSGQKGLATAAQITKLDGIEALADVTDATNVAAAGAVMDSDFTPSEGMMRKTGAGAYTAHKTNLTAVTNPDENDDSSSGYSAGSVWLNTTEGSFFMCVDASVGAAVWSSGGGGLKYEVITSSQTAVKGYGYLLNPSAALTLTLPASPAEGDTVAVVDTYNMATTYTLTVARNSSNIEGSAEDLVIDVDGAGFTLVYADATRGWEIVSEVGAPSVADLNLANYVDRGDPSSVDFDQTDLTADGSWHDLDLSSIVPSNAIAVYLVIKAQDDAVNNVFRLRENGNTNEINILTCRTQVVNQFAEMNGIVRLDSNQTIEYCLTSTTWSYLRLTVGGWYTSDNTQIALSETTFDYQKYVDRGDCSSEDWAETDLTTDGTWRDLDCSGIVPSNAVAIVFRVYLKDGATGSYLCLRENGNSNAINALAVRTQAVDVGVDMIGIVPCDSNQVVEYLASNTTFTTIDIVVQGWFTEDDQTAVGSGNVYAPDALTDNALIRGDGGSRNAQTSAVTVSDDGEMVNTSQPCFLLRKSGDDLNVTGDATTYNLTGSGMWNEIFDVGSNVSDGTFTAPVTGKYQFNVTVRFADMTASHGRVLVVLQTSNRNHYIGELDPSETFETTTGGDRLVVSASVLTDMDASDTAYVWVFVDNATKVVDIEDTYTCWSGVLVC